jgi:hypothetical protein
LPKGTTGRVLRGTAFISFAHIHAVRQLAKNGSKSKHFLQKKRFQFSQATFALAVTRCNVMVSSAGAA